MCSFSMKNSLQNMRNIVVVFVLVIQTVSAQNNNNIVREGATCELSSNEKGICIRLSLCSSARELLKQRKIPENCGFINGIPITCCPKGPRKIIHLAEKKCKYIELSRFGFIGDTLSSESFTSNDEQSTSSEENDFPFRIKFPTTTTATTTTTTETKTMVEQHNIITTNFSRFPLEEEIENKFKPKDEKTNIIPNDLAFPLKEDEPDIIFEKEENTNIFPSGFSRFSLEDKADVKFEGEEKNTNTFPIVFSRFGFDENESSENIRTLYDGETSNQKIRTHQDEFSISVDFSRFSYSPTNKEERHIGLRQRIGDHSQDNLIQHETDLLPKLDISSKDISDLIIRETPNYVLGGQNAKIKEFPHMAALGYESNNETLWLCGGSLISDEYVLTAAHCLNSLDYGPLKFIRLGDINKEPGFLQTSHQDFQVEKAIPYPLYRPSSTYHDIALVKLDRKAIINDFVNTACFFTEEEIPSSLELWATGWGLTAEYGNQSDILQKVELNLFSEDECNNVYKARNQLKYGILHKQQICAGGRVDQKDTCKGDSGGPLQIKVSREDGDVYYIAGVTSFGKLCGNKNIPGIYTRVSFYISWIENIIWPNE